MSYQVRRIDPYWHAHPVVPVLVVVGAAIGVVGYQSQQWALTSAGLLLAAASVVFATKLVVSAVLGTLGLLGGVATFILWPNVQMAGASLLMKAVAAVLFGLAYMVCMDALVLTIALLYNLYSTALPGLALEFEEGPSEGA